MLGNQHCGGLEEKRGVRRRSVDVWLSGHLQIYRVHRAQRGYPGGHKPHSRLCRVLDSGASLRRVTFSENL